MLPKKKYAMSIIGEEPKSLDDLALGVIKVISKKAPVLGFAWDVRYADVSNTHSCPESGKTNWSGRNPDAPRSYPGWSGRVWIRVGPNNCSFGSDLFSQTLTYSGTGGAGGYSGPFSEISRYFWDRYGYKRPANRYPDPLIYSYDYRFYADDWPEVASLASQQVLFDKLSAGKNTIQHHKFEWFDEATLEKDQAFIEECKALQEKKNAKQTA